MFCWSPNVLVLKIWPAFRQFVAIRNRMKLADSAGHSAFAQTARSQCRSAAAATFALKRALNHDKSTPRARTRARPSWTLPPTARPSRTTKPRRPRATRTKATRAARRPRAHQRAAPQATESGADAVRKGKVRC